MKEIPMFKSLMIVATLALSSLSYADSLHPCTPTVELEPFSLTCKGEEVDHYIVIRTLRSPADPMCSGENFREYETAEVEVVDVKTRATLKTFWIKNGEFKVRSGKNTRLNFESEKHSLKLEGCIAPYNGGGMSVGN
jgi:hypothetical protein